MRKVVLLLLAMMLVAGTAFGATFSFDGPGIASKHDSLSFTEDGITLTATAPGEEVAYYWEGLGVSQGGWGSNTLEDNETLLISFDQTVILSEIWFRQWENNGDRVVFFSGSDGTDVTFADSGQGVFELVDYFYMDDLILDSFTITGNASGTAAWLKGLNVETYVPVPIPGAIWLIGSGLFLLAGTRRIFRKN